MTKPFRPPLFSAILSIWITCLHHELWDCDIRGEEGEKIFKFMAEEIKQACAAL